MALVETAFDRRIKAGVSSCGILSYEGMEGSQMSAEAVIPGFRERGYDSSFFLSRISPIPFLATSGKGEKRTEALRSLFQGNVESLEFDGGHEFPHPVRESCYRFLDRHLDRKDPS